MLIPQTQMIATKNKILRAHHTVPSGWEFSKKQKSMEAVNRLINELEEAPEDESLMVYSGIALQRIGNFRTSKSVLEGVVKKSPYNLLANRYHAKALLNVGEWREGFLKMEQTRGELTPLQQVYCQDMDRLWTGQDIAGKHIVAVGNGRQSDEIQFSRYIKELRRLNPHKIGLVCGPEMVELMRTLKEINRVDCKMFEPFDYFIPLESLPFRLGADPSGIPNEPYLGASDHRINSKRAMIRSVKPLLGICWRNHQPEAIDDEELEYKTIVDQPELKSLEPYLMTLKQDYDLVSFQQGLRVDEREILNRCGCQIIEDEQFSDFENIAEWLACLDNLIAVDSPIAHLAGALGIEGHILLPYIPDWKWWVRDGVSQWNPSLTIHKKVREHCWRSCLDEVVRSAMVPRVEMYQKAS